MLPNTIVCTLTAVPQSPGISLSLLYTIALGLSHDLNTALTAPINCSLGSCGNSSPFMASLYTCLNLFANSLRSFASSSVSYFTPFFSFISSIIFSKKDLGTSITTSEYIWINLLYESYANLGLPVFFANPSTAISLRPRFRIVSIIPGIDALAPDLTDTNRGSSLSPNFLLLTSSSHFNAVKIWSLISSEICFPLA